MLPAKTLTVWFLSSVVQTSFSRIYVDIDKVRHKKTESLTSWRSWSRYLTTISTLYILSSKTTCQYLSSIWAAWPSPTLSLVRLALVFGIIQPLCQSHPSPPSTSPLPPGRSQGFSQGFNNVTTSTDVYLTMILRHLLNTILPSSNVFYWKFFNNNFGFTYF